MATGDDRGMVTSGRVWWPTAVAVSGVLVAPFFAVDAPPVLDYPNHLARLYVLAFGQQDPVLSAMYAPHWRILPNLVIDVIGPPLMHLVPVSVAGRLLLALAALLPVAGIVVYHRAAFRTRSLWPLASALVACNAAFLLGFMNFLYSAGLAMAAAAVWMRLAQRRLPLAVAVAVAANVILFFCHLLGVLFFMLLIGAHEVAALAAARVAGQAIGRRLLSRGLALALSVAPAAVLYGLSAMAHASGPTTWDLPERRLDHLLTPFATYDATLTVATAIIVVGAVFLMWQRERFDRGSVVAFVALAVAYTIAPGQMKSGALIDLRLPILMGFLVFAGVQPSLSRKTGIALATILGALLLVRTAYLGEVWSDHRRDLADLREIYGSVEPGAKVLVVSAARTASAAYRAAEPRGRELPFLFRTDEHLPALMLIERHAFWPLLFTDPRQQPLAVLPPYAALADPLGEPRDYHLLAEGNPALESPRTPAYLRRLRDFDYVLLLDAGAAEASGSWADQLQLVRRSDIAALYRVARD